MGKKKKQKAVSLSPGQLEIMEIVWEQGEVSAFEIREIIAQSRNVSRNTVKTNLERIEAKGWLTHRVIGRTHFYKATVDRNQGLAKRVLNLVDKACGGDPQKLMLALLNSRELTVQEIDQIQDLLSEARKKNSRKRQQKK